MNVFNKRVLFFAFVGIVVLTLVFLFFFLQNKVGPTNQKAPAEENSKKILHNFELDYSKINLLVPGKSTLADVIRINGKPENEVSATKKTYLYYNTPSSDYQNIVLIENGIVVYAKEKVFRNNRGLYSDFAKKYGSPPLTLYEIDNPDFEWSVFLKNGVAVFHSESYISSILYFIPQEKNGFLENIARDLDMTEEKPEEIGYPATSTLEL